MPRMTLDEALSTCLPKVEARIRERIGGASMLDEMATYHFATGGKRIRGILPSFVCANLGGDAASAIALGAGLEVLHNATLIHDDVQDGDTHRRGWPTVWAKWGVAQAINVGDSLFFQGLALLAEDPAGLALLPGVCAAMDAVVRGQVMEFQLQRPPGSPEALPVSLDSVRAVAEAKTGALFGICLTAGGAAAGRSAPELESLRSFGIGAGLLFQVQDDYLDLVGDKGRGERGSDLKEGKLSFPVVWAVEHAAPAVAEELLAIVRTPREATSDGDVARALALLEACGALAATAEWLRTHRDRAARNPCAEAVPGLVERFLAPVAHAI